MRAAIGVALVLLCVRSLAASPSDVLVLSKHVPDRTTALGALVHALSDDRLVRAVQAPEAAAAASRPGVLLVVPAEGWPAGTEDAVSAVLSNRGTVLALLGPASADRARGAGILADPLPRSLGWVWGEPPLTMAPLAAETDALAIRPTWALADGARYDALILAGRKQSEPEAIRGFALRWHTGERVGSSLVAVSAPDSLNPLLGAGVGPLHGLLEWLDRPYLVSAAPDYATVREGEGLRVLIDARSRPRDETPLRLEVWVRSPAGQTLARGALEALERAPVGDGRDLHALSGVVRIPSRRWPGPRLEVETRLVGEAGRLLDARRSVAAVWDERSLRRTPPSRASGSRVSVQGSMEPLFSWDVTRPWGCVPGGAPDAWDLGAWFETFEAAADAGARTVRFGAAPDGDGARPEWARRMDEGRAALALAAGLSPEIVYDGLAGGAHPSSGVLSRFAGPLASAGLPEERELLAETWGVERVLPPPVSGPHRGEPLSDALEAELMGGRELVRLATPDGPDAATAWRLTLLGAAGTVTSTADAPPAPRMSAELLRANLLSRLLQPSLHIPEAAVVVERGAVGAPASSRVLGDLALDWRAVRADHARDIGTATKAVVVEDASQLSEDAVEWLLAWTREGGWLLLGSVDGKAPERVERALGEVTETPWGRAARVGLGEAHVAGPGRFAEMLSRALPDGVGPPLKPADAVTRPGSARNRVRRNALTSGGAVVGVETGEPAWTVTESIAGHTVELTASPGCPAVAAATETGVWFIATSSRASVDGAPLIEGDACRRIEIASLVGAPIRESRDFLLFVQGDEEREFLLGLAPGIAEKDTFELHALRPARGKLNRLETRRCERVGDALRIRLKPSDDGLPLVITSPDRLEKALERVTGLIW